MHSAVLQIHGGLALNSRLPALAREHEGLRGAEVLFLLGTGAVAALASAFLDFGLRIPGHASFGPCSPWPSGWRSCRGGSVAA